MLKRSVLVACFALLAATGAFAADPTAPMPDAPVPDAVAEGGITVCPAADPVVPTVVPAGGNPQCPSCNTQAQLCRASCDGLILFECQLAWPCDYLCECWEL